MRRERDSRTLYTHHSLAAVAVGAFVLCAGSATLAGTHDTEPSVNLLISEPGYTSIQIDMPSFSFADVKIDGVDYVTPIMPGTAAAKANPGAPDLPEFVRSLHIPGDARMAVAVSEVQTEVIPDVLIAPNRGAIDRSQDPRDVPYWFGDEYQKDEFFPANLVSLGTPWIMRSHRGLEVRVSPFQYNPITKELKVVTGITFKVTEDGPAEDNPLLMDQPRSARLGFREMFADVFINWEPEQFAPIVPTGIEMLIIAPEAWLDEVQPLVTHRNMEGIITVSRSIESIGNTPEKIKDHIAGEYLGGNFGIPGWDLSYVLLVGDIDQIASDTITYSGDTGATDPEYGYILGDDQRPEVFIGRFPAASAAEATLMVERTIAYESQIDVFNPYRGRALGIASDDGDGTSADDLELDWQHLNNIRGDLLASGYSSVDQVYDPGASNAAALTSVDGGVGLINYTGHGSKNNWTTSNFTSGDVNDLNNKGMWPWIISVACDVGRFNDGSCFAEAWLRATSDDGEATGAVAAFMSTIYQNWAPPMEGQDVINAHEAAGTLPRLGPRCAAGTNSMLAAYPGAGPRNAKTWHLFGDPALRLTPQSITIKPIDWPLIHVHPGAAPLPPFTMEIDVHDDFPRDVEILWDNPWIDVSPRSMTVQPGQTKEVTVTVDVEALASMDLGEHLASLVLFDHTTGDASNACVARGEVSQAPCAGDLNGDGAVAVEDLLVLISQWGPCSEGCQADTDGNGAVDLNDLLSMLGSFGPC